MRLHFLSRHLLWREDIMRLAVTDTELYFDVEGAGIVLDGPAMRERPTLVALHGGPGFDHTYFKPWLSPLIDTAQIIYLDQRGQGRSGRPPMETCSPEQMADDAAAFCRALGIERPVVLGHSYGGFVALHLAVRHPGLAERLILVDTAAGVSDMGDAMGTLEQRYGPEARAAGERTFSGDFSEEAMADFARLVLPAYLHNQALLPAMGEVMARTIFNAEVSTHFFSRLAGSYDLRARLPEIKTPTLVIVGDDDFLLPPSASRAIAAGIPGADLLVIDGAGHFPFIEHPDKFNAAIRRFLGSTVAV
jgi:proline iminopeptidase